MKTTATYLDVLKLCEELRGAGYQMGKPAWVSIESARIDRSVCRRMTCPVCGHRDVRPQLWFRPQPKSYRCFAVCKSCDHAEEI